jgi:hypothetical protein
MRADIVWLRMPFKYGIIFREKNVPFLFKIMTLEMTCDDLGVEFGDLFSKDNAEVDIYASILFNGYLAACKELYKKPKYSEAQGMFWAEHMAQSSRNEFMEGMKKLLGYMKNMAEVGEAQKKK